MTKVSIAPGDYAGLHKGVVSIVETARSAAARNVNAVMTVAYWEIGRRIVASEQGGQARADYGQALIARAADDLMHLYLNYAREHWVKPGENPPVGLILCAQKGAAEARYALDNLPNKILAAEYQTVLPDETLIAEELERTRAALEKRKMPCDSNEAES
ncbi:hypothetical protein LMG28727_07542 [Paraburkholderia kirstenboschensis]|uniref:PDDEXK nuclease domain-containing protein n=1 Tax=Paraburkholderia kirstenboschensis TaxID=1245436 RepID=UPI000ABA5AF3|nr:PDDEXK nuclease domain-containing protein [Paraburkholderia kirstenboschensis]CAD6561770.1 hypothetical protein LMG28727_07542 [Paraburkholderia kirstenboschensis]